MSESDPVINTPLFSAHERWGGKMTAFAGYRLPLSYADGGLIAEHVHTREQASLFDVSHMGQVLLPPAAAAVLASVMPINPDTIKEGASKYTVLMNDDGGVIDDCIVANDGDRGWFVVFNASRKTTDVAYVRSRLAAPSQLFEYDDRALLAVQGPAAAALVAAIFPQAESLGFMRSVWCESGGAEYRVCRCGYTGEDGYEISAPQAAAVALADRLMENPALKPAGLGARDSLRLEAGLCLYGNELDENTSPIEAGLLWTIPKTRRVADAGYPGAAVVSRHIESGAPRRLAALLPQGRTLARQGTVVKCNGATVGMVTSGSYSPTLEKSIALAYVVANVPADAELTVEVRGKESACLQTTLPFVPHRYKR